MDQPKGAHWQQNHLLQHGRAFQLRTLSKSLLAKFLATYMTLHGAYLVDILLRLNLTVLVALGQQHLTPDMKDSVYHLQQQHDLLPCIVHVHVQEKRSPGAVKSSTALCDEGGAD